MIIKVVFVAAIFFIVRNILKSISYYNKLKEENIRLKKDQYKSEDSVDAEYTVMDDDK